MSEFKFVFVKEIHDAKTAKGSAYYYFLDHENVRWNIFPEKIRERLEPKKGYIIEFEKLGEFNNLITIRPAINKLLEQAGKELANKNDIIRNFTVCMSYSKDLAVAQLIKLDEIENWANKFYKSIMDKANSEKLQE